MSVFGTGATGYLGSVIVREVLSVGHQVLVLTHSDASEANVTSAGASMIETDPCSHERTEVP